MLSAASVRSSTWFARSSTNTFGQSVANSPFRFTRRARHSRTAVGRASANSNRHDDDLWRRGANIGQPTAVRAVAKANGDNRISIIIPCHRVIGSDGSLTGYGGGLERKQQLLDLEGGALALDARSRMSS